MLNQCLYPHETTLTYTNYIAGSKIIREGEIYATIPLPNFRHPLPSLLLQLPRLVRCPRCPLCPNSSDLSHYPRQRQGSASSRWTSLSSGLHSWSLGVGYADGDAESARSETIRCGAGSDAETEFASGHGHERPAGDGAG